MIQVFCYVRLRYVTLFHFQSSWAAWPYNEGSTFLPNVNDFTSQNGVHTLVESILHQYRCESVKPPRHKYLLLCRTENCKKFGF